MKPTNPSSEFIALLEAVASAPGDDTPILVAADWLDEHAKPEPIPDRWSGRMPGWFAKGWRANHPRPGSRFVDQEMQNEAGALVITQVFDHWGCGFVAGVFCLVSEPYLAVESIPSVLPVVRRIAELCGGVGLISRESSWNPPRTKRLIWAPHPKVIPGLARADLSARRR